MAAAFVEFADKGFMATRLDDVATRAGVVKGTIYRYYENKDALFEAAVRARILPLLDEAGALVAQFPGSSAELMRLVLKAIYARIADPDARTLLRIMIAEGPKFPALLAFYHREFLSKAIALVQSVIDTGIARGEFRKSAATDLPLVFMAPGLLAAIWQMTFATFHPATLAQFEAAHADLILGALLVERPESRS